MRFIDAHIHLSDPEYNDKQGQIVKVARQAGVVAMVSNSMNLATSKLNLRLADEYAGLVYAALGVHPWSVGHLGPNELEQIVDLIQENGRHKGRIAAIGEVGLDPQYAKQKVHKDEQVNAFHEMLRLAEKLELPVIVHSRWSAQRILDILPSYRLKSVLWHWFSGPVELLPRIAERGDYVSEGPPVAFSNGIQQVVRVVSLERLLTETDGPVRYYGLFKDKPTTPAFIPEVVKAISRVKGVDESQVAGQILRNFESFFDLKL